MEYKYLPLYTLYKLASEECTAHMAHKDAQIVILSPKVAAS